MSRARRYDDVQTASLDTVKNTLCSAGDAKRVDEVTLGGDGGKVMSGRPLLLHQTHGILPFLRPENRHRGTSHEGDIDGLDQASDSRLTTNSLSDILV